MTGCRSNNEIPFTQNSGHPHESFIRWQEITRNHFSTVANLILGLATGLLAFQSTLLLEHKLASCVANTFANVSLILLFVSVTFGLWCSVNRLRDFRLTSQIARRRESGEAELQDLREESKSLGKSTWIMFWFQITLFGLGAGCGAVAVVFQILSK